MDPLDAIGNISNKYRCLRTKREKISFWSVKVRYYDTRRDRVVVFYLNCIGNEMLICRFPR